MRAMLIPLKITVILLLLLLSTGAFVRNPAGILLAIPALTPLVFLTRRRMKIYFKKSAIIIGFASAYVVFATLTRALQGDLSMATILLTGLKIILVYWVVLFAGPWLGKNGIKGVVSMMPSLRLRLFLILFIRTVGSLVKSHTSIVNQLRSRMRPSYNSRLLIARYYVQNLIEKELYSYQFHQAAILTRITADPEIYVAPERVRPAHLVTAASAAALYAISIIVP